jgi:HEAT repeat protein
MKPLLLVSISVLALFTGLTSSAPAAGETELKEFFDRIQSRNPDARQAAVRVATKMGIGVVGPLGDLVDSTNRPVSLSAQAALKNIAAYAGRPAAAAERRAVAEAFTKLLDKEHSRVLRTLALELLSITGDDAVVPNITALLADAEVRDEARRALEGIPGPASLKALIEAAGKTEGAFRVAVLGSLGQKAAPEAKEALVAATGSTDTEVVLAALDALARLGIDRDDRVILPDWESLTDEQRTRLAGSWLRWAEQRAAKGAIEDALEAYGGIFERAQGEHLICAALIGAGKIAPDKVIGPAIKALVHESNKVRETALQFLAQHPGDESQVADLLKAYSEANPERRALILRVLSAWNVKKLGSF